MFMTPRSQEDPDEDLLDRIGRGDDPALRMLIARKLPRIYSLARRLLGDDGLADDVAQDAFLRVWRQASIWRPGEARFDTWLHRVVLNLCYDRLRKKRETSIAELPEQIDPAPGADQQLERDESGKRVRAALDTLPPRQREAIMLQVYQELPQTETAKIMGISIEALESLLSRARRSLRTQLQETER